MAKWPYNTPQWKRLRKQQLALFPYCFGCEAEGRWEEANTVDHVRAISDGGAPFPGHDGLRSYCTSCHSKKTARGPEAGAYRSKGGGCDADGNPLDDRHPWKGGNGKWSREMMDRRMPRDLQPSRIPLTIVCGPPGSGKSTHVRTHAGPNDRVICFDTIMAKISGMGPHHQERRYIGRVLDTRNAMLRKLATDTKHDRAWFIVQAPDPAERRLWASRLGGELLVINTPLPECIRRINADPDRPDYRREIMIKTAWAWWDANPHLNPNGRPKPMISDDF